MAPVDLTSTDYARMTDLVNLYKSLRWEPLMPRISLSPNRSGLTDVGRWTAVTPRWSGRARGCADPSALKSVNDSALRSCVARQTEHCYWFEQFQITDSALGASGLGQMLGTAQVTRLWRVASRPL